MPVSSFAKIMLKKCRKATGGMNMVKAHDYFNLVALAILNGLNFWFLATAKNFELFFMATLCYFCLDMLMVGIWPQCVKSPVVIMGHHIITSAYVLIPYHYPDYQWCMAYCMLVEINTWLLIARRNIRVEVFNVLFYVSWVILRNILYPYLIFQFYFEWQAESKKCGSWLNPILITPIFQTFLTGLNYYWTIELCVKTLKSKAHL